MQINLPSIFKQTKDLESHLYKIAKIFFLAICNHYITILYY